MKEETKEQSAQEVTATDEVKQEEQAQQVQEPVKAEEQKQETETPGRSVADDGTIKIDLSKFKLDGEIEEKKEEVETEEVKAVEEVKEETESQEEVKEEVEFKALEEVTEETEAVDASKEAEAEEVTKEITEEVKEEPKLELPEGVEGLIKFINETSGTVEDYVKLNKDYSKASEDQLLREYYEATKPHLDKEDIDILMEDFSYDEEMDDTRDIRKKNIQKKEEVNKAKNFLTGLKDKYYQELKAGSKLPEEAKKAMTFYNERQQKEQEIQKQKETFQKQTEQVFNNEFKGFDFNVGDKKFRLNVNDVDNVKQKQSSIDNFVKKFLTEDNTIGDAKGYHKSLYTAMNPDAIANHFYEQGKADAIKESVKSSKNIDMQPRKSHEGVASKSGFSMRPVESDSSGGKLKIKI